MSKPALQIHASSAEDFGASPWTLGQRIKMVGWEYVWAIFCLWTPKPFNAWRLFVLRCFGATLHGRPFVHQRARIQIPWNLTMHHRACLGDRTNVYTLAPIEIGEEATIAQEAYLCSGTHDFSDANLPLMTAPIRIGARVFVGARAFVLAGVTVHDDAIIGACAVVTKDVPAAMIVAGNPAKVLGPRPALATRA